jgi:hypothetical protein
MESWTVRRLAVGSIDWLDAFLRGRKPEITSREDNDTDEHDRYRNVPKLI